MVTQNIEISFKWQNASLQLSVRLLRKHNERSQKGLRHVNYSDLRQVSTKMKLPSLIQMDIKQILIIQSCDMVYYLLSLHQNGKFLDNDA
ncbi:hypothetical protein TTHERM_00540270 (macronuclear) [Tetrahymena thermophila SB210]|uniref:Uncharacterized protein n=1 Tax=Tetrahymena thermophila (strain SB210) TaxID=312017 RepID=I7MHM7_TETTS|nr:hypothetical protein TTHERM_00540270 [Tetrahymena thermophila SB210]EAR87707.1 hypothetical protein TTHERM_00540270 [Tetrahymena thermophila SB210]|eukprot:XP_001007952.1 hypothetical protein TTHERM_00540270 [Tetrahymena thermophila SB210]